MAGRSPRSLRSAVSVVPAGFLALPLAGAEKSAHPSRRLPRAVGLFVAARTGMNDNRAVAFNEFQLGKDVNRIFQRLALIEEQLKRVSEAVGVPYDDPTDGVAPEVVELAKNGDRLGAIKLYRELTGASVDDAREAIDGL